VLNVFVYQLVSREITKLEMCEYVKIKLSRNEMKFKFTHHKKFMFTHRTNIKFIQHNKFKFAHHKKFKFTNKNTVIKC
jgi:hypothetical protein